MLALLLSASLAVSPARAAEPAEALDHIILESDRSAELFTFFKDVLGLPEVWKYADYSGFTSGGVCAGNVNIEIMAGKTARWRGLAFTGAPLADALPELDRRGIRHSPAQRFTNFSVAFVQELLPAGDILLLVEFHLDTTARNAAAREALARSGGGRLGVIGLPQVSLSADRNLWTRFLAPAPLERPIAESPAIYLTEGSGGVAGVVMAVRSLNAARSALRDLGLLDETGGATRVAGLGVDLLLVESGL